MKKKMNLDKCVDCGRDLSIWDLDENLKGRAWSGVINHTCPDCILKRYTELQPSEPKNTCNCETCVKSRMPKPLAQYLAEYIAYNIYGHDVDRWGTTKWRELLEQALDAYESTEQVKIRIEPA